MKICPGCKEEKPFSEFGKNKAKKDGFQIYCKLCVRAINAEYYKNTPEKNIARRAKNISNRATAKQFIISYLQEHPCVDCGESDIVVLEFDHRGDKLYNISKLLSDGRNIEMIELEIAKCDVRCSNCHKRKTAKDFGWYKLLTEVG